MIKVLPIQQKSNSYSFVKWSSVAVALLLSMGTLTRVNAQAVPEAEVISIPPQEAFFIEDKTQNAPSSDNSDMEDEKTVDESDRKQVVSTRLERGRNLADVNNSTKSTTPYSLNSLNNL
ncbi:MAG: hypothetical protein SAK29_32850 [Scytonema sp. PMC 1069.18]|nr:hypothetical protein [Scytonema sp. PMC 1069.18]MEC4888075.1 hypothetical protein [Scytonema sp. PMC 1070.18]